MNAGEYFEMIINILMGLTLIVLIMIFFYMIYGEKEKTPSPTKKVTLKIFRGISAGLYRFYVLM